MEDSKDLSNSAGVPYCVLQAEKTAEKIESSIPKGDVLQQQLINLKIRHITIKLCYVDMIFSKVLRKDDGEIDTSSDPSMLQYLVFTCQSVNGVRCSHQISHPMYSGCHLCSSRRTGLGTC